MKPLKLLVVKEFTFAAAHYLPGYEGKCANLHGHEWRLQVGYFGVINDKTGMVADFTLIKSEVSKLIEKLDHQCLNSISYKNFPGFYPTAENMLDWFTVVLPDITATDMSFLRLYETPTSYCEWRR
jgi:6-pyruvoyltetrahydropterin/6-carboxytetrahydropterin synthase